jgi:hypothetical protein
MTSGIEYPARAYASPLYADAMTIRGGIYDGAIASVIYAATSNGYVYAVNAFEAPCQARSIAAGAFLWRTRLVNAAQVPNLDGQTTPFVSGIALGTMSTPILDRTTTPPRLYLTAMDSGRGLSFVWKAFALDAESGAVLPGWPVVLSRAAVEPLDKNGPAYFDDDARILSQRGALALSPQGDRLYVTFGGYSDGAVGWIVSINTQTPSLTASFSGGPDTLLDAQGNIARHPNGGMWGPSGPAVDTTGRVYMTTGNSDPSQLSTSHTWGNSLLQWSRDLDLQATYTPYNYCQLDIGDVDVGGSSAVLLPTPNFSTTTPHLIAFGGKQGVVYLVDADHLSGSLIQRPACSTRWDDASRDGSLLPPTPSADYCNVPAPPQCFPAQPSTDCVAGPLTIFGPAGDRADVNHAKMRTTPAYFRSAAGVDYVFVSGSTKAALCSLTAVPPSVVRLRVTADHGGPAYLAKDAADAEITFQNPGSPVVSSHDGLQPVVWVVDSNTSRTQPLLDPTTPHPILYAIDGTTMKLLYRSAEQDLFVGGKYVTPLVAHGTVFVVTDRVQALALH